ncbi:TPA: hypothetical protein OTG90_002395, partial [Staphylococcus pseudintermedius]|nr:hypothetical protein [Staphylococcus pseudintermedius]
MNHEKIIKYNNNNCYCWNISSCWIFWIQQVSRSRVRGSSKIGQATVDAKGNYKLNIKAQKKGTKLTIYGVDKAKNKSKK